jgi:hypothetical protein
MKYVRKLAATHFKPPHPNTHHKIMNTTRNRQWQKHHLEVFPPVRAVTMIIGTVMAIVQGGTSANKAAASVDRAATPVGGTQNDNTYRPKHRIIRKQKDCLLKHKLVQNGAMATTTTQEVKVARWPGQPRRTESALKTKATRHTTTTTLKKLTTTR